MKYKLQDLIDMEHFQNLQERLNKIYSFPSSIIDNDGNILTATAWQDVCTKFHRTNKDCERECIKSDQYIRDHLHEANPAVSYLCPHGLVDNATPIIIDGIHYGNFFTGQFFLDEPDLDFFRAQAQEYGFDEDAYLDAVKRVPIWNQEQLNNYLFFIKGLIAVISESGLKKLKEIESRKRIEISEKRHKSILKSAMDGYWLTDTEGQLLEVNDAYCRMSGYSEKELLNIHIPDLEAVEDPQLVAEHMKKVISQGSDRFESKHRRKDGTVFDVEVSIQFRSEEGGQCVCFLRDITERKQAEKSLQVSEKKYRTLFENMAQGIFYQRADGVLFDYNNAALEMFGLTPDQFIGKTSLDPQWKVINEDGTDLPGDKHPSMVALQTGEPVKDSIVGVYNPRRKNYNWLVVTAIPQFKNPGEKPYQVFVTLQDITDRRQAEQQYQMLFQKMLDGFALHEIICDATGQPVDYRFLAVNPAFEKMTGLRADLIVGRTVLEVLPGIEQHWIETYGRVALSGEPATFENYSADIGKHFQITAFQFAPDQFVCIFMDITERKIAELALRESEEKFRNFTDQSFVGFYILQDGLLKYVNPKFAEMFGYTVDECLDDMPYSQLVHPEDLSTVNEQIRRRETGEIESVQYTFRGIKKTGEIIHAAVYGSSLMHKERPAAIGTLLDITKELEMKKRMAQSQKMESIGTLAGGIAHDFNNILFPIVGHIEMLMEDTPEDSPLRDSLNEIYTSSLRARDLVQQILAFSHQEKSELKLMKMQPIIKEALKLIRSTIPTTISVNQNIQSDCGAVKADPTQIHQIVMNLATNAYHAMEKNGGELKVTLKEIKLGEHGLIIPGMKPGSYACLTIADTGTGMDMKTIDKIFDPFFTTKGKGKGTGMGLSVVHGIVKGMNGAIKVYSEPGKGTEFHVYLPVVKTNLLREETPTNKPLQGGTDRILLVDDEKSIISMEKQVLERLGYQVTSFTGSIEALEAFRAGPDKFDLVITDKAMPKMPGDKLAAELIKIRHDIPILLCTGFSESMSEEKIKSIGVKGLLLKPIIIKDLAQKMREILDNKKFISLK